MAQSVGYSPQTSKANSNENQAFYSNWAAGLNGLSPSQISQPASQISTGGIPAPTVNPNQGSIDLINSALSRVPGQVDTATQNIQNQANQQLNQINSGEQAAQGQYNTGTSQNQQQFVTNKNQINDQSSQGLQSLLRVLGAHGAGGSSTALYAAPNAVGQTASVQRAGAGQNYGQNQQNLDTTWNNYETGVSDSKKQLSDWLNSQVRGALTTGQQSEQSLLQQLAGLQTNQAAAQPIIDQINASAAAVDNLAKSTPSYTGVTPTYTAPDVNSYTVAQAGAPVLGGNNTSTGAGTPILNFLLGKDKQTQTGLPTQVAPAF